MIRLTLFIKAQILNFDPRVVERWQSARIRQLSKLHIPIKVHESQVKKLAGDKWSRNFALVVSLVGQEVEFQLLVDALAILSLEQCEEPPFEVDVAASRVDEELLEDKT